MINSIENLISKDLKIGLQMHTTPESIFNEHWNFKKDMTFEELLKSPCGGEDERGVEIEMTLQELFDGMVENKYWGFADLKARKIHIWVAAGFEIETDVLRILIGHEVGHILEQKQLDENPYIAEEQRCDNYGLACLQMEAFIRQLSIGRR